MMSALEEWWVCVRSTTCGARYRRSLNTKDGWNVFVRLRVGLRLKDGCVRSTTCGPRYPRSLRSNGGSYVCV